MWNSTRLILLACIPQLTTHSRWTGNRGLKLCYYFWLFFLFWKHEKLSISFKIHEEDSSCLFNFFWLHWSLFSNLSPASWYLSLLNSFFHLLCYVPSVFCLFQVLHFLSFLSDSLFPRLSLIWGFNVFTPSKLDKPEKLPHSGRERDKQDWGLGVAEEVIR